MPQFHSMNLNEEKKLLDYLVTNWLVTTYLIQGFFDLLKTYTIICKIY